MLYSQTCLKGLSKGNPITGCLTEVSLKTNALQSTLAQGAWYRALLKSDDPLIEKTTLCSFDCIFTKRPK